MFISRCARTRIIHRQRHPDPLPVIESKLQQLHTAYLELKSAPLKDRINQVEVLRDHLNKQKLSLSEAISFDMGKSPSESLKEIEKTMYHCDYYIKNAEEFLKPQTMKMGKFKTKTSFEASGVIFKIAPFNFPVWVAFKMVIPNLILGNSVLVRPAATCLGVGNALEELIKASNINSCDIGFTSIDDTEQIIQNQFVSGVSFTGSTNSGKIIGQQTGKHLKRCVLELGGSDAFVITELSPTEKVIEDSVTGKFISKAK